MRFDLVSLMTAARFGKLRRSYAKRWNVGLLLVDASGTPVFRDENMAPVERQIIKKLLSESLHWGEAPVEMSPGGSIVWLVPLLLNTSLVGGVAAFIDQRLFFPNDDGIPAFDVRDAARDLLQRLEENNLTNVPLLELRRMRYMNERRRAEAIHSFKSRAPDFRAIYLHEEPALMSSIRKGDREEARRILNHILVALHHQAGDNLALIKSFFMELVTLMCRAAVETGCEARELLGKNYERFTELSAIASEETLSPWVHDILERLIDSIHRHRNGSHTALLQAALSFMHENIAEDVTRDMAAREAHMSPSHFSRMFKREMRESFTDRLNRMRVEHAAEIIAASGRSLSLIALDCGFKDQSYFTKVFRKYMRSTPREYRLRLASARMVDPSSLMADLRGEGRNGQNVP